MYSILLLVHSWLRWAVIIIAIIAIYQSFVGWRSKKVYTSANDRVNVAFISVLHIQLLLGLLLYFFLSPITQAAMQDFKSAMKNDILRFWAIEHMILMFVGVTVAQIGRVVSKKSPDPVTKHKKIFIYFTIAIILILAGVPWTQIGRPLFRM